MSLHTVNASQPSMTFPYTYSIQYRVGCFFITSVAIFFVVLSRSIGQTSHLTSNHPDKIFQVSDSFYLHSSNVKRLTSILVTCCYPSVKASGLEWIR